MKKNILKVATAIIVATTTFWVFSNVNASELNLEVKKYKTVEDVVISLETFDKQISQIVDIDYTKVDFSILKELSPQFVGQDKCLSKNLYISNF